MTAIGDFAELAERYCNLLDLAGRAERMRFLARVEEILSKLYTAASALPEVEPAAARSSDREPMTSAEWGSRFGELREVMVEETNLIDDLMEIYRSLGSGLRLARSGAPPDEVIGRWRSDFDGIWAGSAERALFDLRNLIDRASS